MAFDGWIYCGKHEPPEGMEFDVRHGDGFVIESEQAEPVSWEFRVEDQHRWRPSAKDGWKRSLGVVPDCERVDVVMENGFCRFGQLSSCLIWTIVNRHIIRRGNIAYWRPHKEPTETPEPVVQEAQSKSGEHSEVVFDGWIKCGEHQPPEWMEFDVKHKGGYTAIASVVTRDLSWRKRVSEGDSWRPSEAQGWRRNDGMRPDCERVDVVLNDGLSMFGAYCLSCRWGLMPNPRDIAYWRPHKEPANTPEPLATESPNTPVFLPTFKSIDDAFSWIEYSYKAKASKRVLIKCESSLFDSKQVVEAALRKEGFAIFEAMIDDTRVLVGALLK